MTLSEAKKLKAGDCVLWPEGANGCREDHGIVKYDAKYGALYAEWSDGQRTYLHDKDAVKYIRSEALVRRDPGWV